MSEESPNLEDLVEQYTDLCHRGSAPSPRQFATEHPDFAAELEELLPLVADMTHAAQSDDLKDEPELPELPGSDYRLLRLIGNGAMGRVYEAEQLSLERRCAVKLLSPSLLQEGGLRRQFEQESRVIAKLKHPNIVEVFGAGSTSGHCYYAMELIDGTGLDKYRPRNLRELAKSACRRHGPSPLPIISV